MPDLPYGRAADGTPVSFMRRLELFGAFKGHFLDALHLKEIDTDKLSGLRDGTPFKV